MESDKQRRDLITVVNSLLDNALLRGRVQNWRWKQGLWGEMWADNCFINANLHFTPVRSGRLSQEEKESYGGKKMQS